MGSVWCYFDLKVNLPTRRNSFSLFSFTTLSSLYWSLLSNVWPLFQYFSQISQAVTTTQPSLTQTTVMETVTMVTTREQILVKHGHEELPPPPPQKKRQIIVDSEIRKRWESLFLALSSSKEYLFSRKTHFQLFWWQYFYLDSISRSL